MMTFTSSLIRMTTTTKQMLSRFAWCCWVVVPPSLFVCGDDEASGSSSERHIESILPSCAHDYLHMSQTTAQLHRHGQPPPPVAPSDLRAITGGLMAAGSFLAPWLAISRDAVPRSAGARRSRVEPDRDGLQSSHQHGAGNNDIDDDVNGVSARSLERLRIAQFPLVDVLRHVHAIEVDLVSAATGAIRVRPALVGLAHHMRGFAVAGLRARLVALLQLLYCGAEDARQLARVLLPGNDGYVEVRTTARDGGRAIVSDVAPLLVDLCAYETAVMELLGSWGLAPHDDEGVDAARDAASPQHTQERYDSQLARARELNRACTRLVRRDDGVAVAASAGLVDVASGFAGKTARWVSLWRANRTLRLSDAEQLALLRGGAVVGSASLPVLDPNITFSRGNLLLSFRDRCAGPAPLPPPASVAHHHHGAATCDASRVAPRRVVTAAPPHSLERLPHELLAEIFAYLVPSGVHAAAVTCAAWRRVICARVALRRVVQLAGAFTRRVAFFMASEWGATCVRLAMLEKSDDDESGDDDDHDEAHVGDDDQ